MSKNADILRFMRNFKVHQGYVEMSELKEKGFHTSEIKELLDTGKIEKIKSGLYRLSNFPEIPNVRLSFIDVSHAIEDSVICLLSALDFHNLTTFNPSEVFIAIPRASKPKNIIYPPVKVFYFSEKNYNFGIQEIKTKYGIVKIYDKEKSICDIFRYRSKLGYDLAIESLKMYLKLKDSNIPKLLKYAEACEIKNIISKHIEILIS